MSILTSICLRNFKCFRDVEIEISGLTILAGLNGMGKSSVIQALLLLRQSFGFQNRGNRRLKLNGEFAELGTGADVFFDLADDDELSIGYEFEEEKGQAFRSTYRYEYDRRAENLRPASSTEAFNNRLDEYWDEEKKDWVQITRDNQANLPRAPLPQIYSTVGFQYISAERLGPRKLLPSSEEHSRLRQVGSQGEFVLGVLANSEAGSLNDADPRLHPAVASQSLKSQVEGWLQEISPGTRLEINSYSEIDAHTSRFSFERKGDVPSKPFRPSNVGFGISYVLPVIAALLCARQSSILVIENPEAHLHPKGQTRLGFLAAQASAAGVQVIVETHSDHFLDGVRLAARDRRCDPKNVAIHYFSRFGSEAAVMSPELLEDGRLTEWPEGFFDERDDNLAKLLSPLDEE